MISHYYSIHAQKIVPASFKASFYKDDIDHGYNLVTGAVRKKDYPDKCLNLASFTGP